MRIEDIFNYREPVMEAPYGAFQNVKDTVASKFGGQEAAGNKEVGTEANTLYSGFKKYVGQVSGPGQKFIEAEHLIDYLESKGVNANIGKKPSDKITPKEAEQLILQAVRNSKRVQPKQTQPAANTQTVQQSQQKPQQPSSSEADLAKQIQSLTPDELKELRRLLA